LILTHAILSKDYRLLNDFIDNFQFFSAATVFDVKYMDFKTMEFVQYNLTSTTSGLYNHLFGNHG